GERVVRVGAEHRRRGQQDNVLDSRGHGLGGELIDVRGLGVQEDRGHTGKGGREGGRVGQVEPDLGVGGVGGDPYGQVVLAEQGVQVGGDRAAASGDEDH